MVLWCWWAAAVLAAPLTVPAGEEPAEWRRALDHAGVELGAVEVTIEARGPAWVVSVRTAEGEVRTAEVAPVSDADGREEVALLCASLVRDASRVGGLSLPTLEVPPAPKAVVPRSAPAAPAPEVAAARSPGDELLPQLRVPASVEPAVTSLRVEVPAEVVPASVEVEPVAAVSPFVRVGPAMALRARVRTATVGQLWGGAAGPWWRLGLGVELGSRALVEVVDDDTRLQSTDLAVGAWAGPGWLELGPVAALSLRDITEDEGDPGAHRNGWLGAEAAVRIPVDRVDIRVGARLARDLRPTELRIANGAPLRVLDPWHGGVGISVGTSGSAR